MFLNFNKQNIHVSSDTVNEFESVILADSFVCSAKSVNRLLLKVVFFAYRVARKFGFSTIPGTKDRFIKNPLLDKKHIFTVMMGLDEAKYKPYGFTSNHCRSIFLFDAWEKDYRQIVDFVKKYKIDFVFVTASQSAENLNNLLGRKKVYWVPEGIKIDEYRFKDNKDKSIDILAIGRKYDMYHDSIKNKLEKAGRKYRYEKIKGEIIFPTREEFIAGLADTKISVCVPSSITHPERAGNIETMTIRYLQSMVSKCLVVGHAPTEMIDLFGYNPVIEIDYSRPAEQLKEILDNYESYIPLIEKNYKNVIENHTWEHRWNHVKDIFKNLSES